MAFIKKSTGRICSIIDEKKELTKEQIDKIAELLKKINKKMINKN